MQAPSLAHPKAIMQNTRAAEEEIDPSVAVSFFVPVCKIIESNEQSVRGCRYFNVVQSEVFSYAFGSSNNMVTKPSSLL